jgi:hypothetical protein
MTSASGCSPRRPTRTARARVCLPAVQIGAVQAGKDLSVPAADPTGAGCLCRRHANFERPDDVRCQSRRNRMRGAVSRNGPARRAVRARGGADKRCRQRRCDRSDRSKGRRRPRCRAMDVCCSTICVPPRPPRDCDPTGAGNFCLRSGQEAITGRTIGDKSASSRVPTRPALAVSQRSGRSGADPCRSTSPTPSQKTFTTCCP